MSDSTRTPLQIKCAFNSFCKKVLKREANNAYRDEKKYRIRYVSFSDLTPGEITELHYTGMQLQCKNKALSIYVNGKRITSRLLSEALLALPKEKRSIIILYYYLNMNDVNIARRCNIPRSTAQYSRKCILKILRQYLEEHADEGSE